MMASGMRSGLLAPVVHHGVTVGMVLLEHRLPRAYGTVDQTCLEEIVASLSPSMAHLASPNQPAAKPREPMLSKEKMPPAPAERLRSLTEALADQTAGIGQAELSAVFMFDRQTLGQSSMADAVIHREGLPTELLAEISDLAAKCCDEGAPVRRSLSRRPENSAIDPFPAGYQPAEFSEEGPWKCLALPLQNAVEMTGVLVLGRSEGLPWTQEEIGLLESFVGEAANEIEMARRNDAERRAISGKAEGR